MEQSISNTERIAINALEGVGLMPTDAAVITPNQKDIFSGPNDPVSKIGMEQLSAELEEKGESKEVIEKVKGNTAKDILDLSSSLPDLEQAIEKEVIPGTEGNEPEAVDKAESKGKSSLVKFLKKKIEAGQYAPYGGEDGYDDAKEKLEDYLNKFNTPQLEDLIDLNQDTRENKTKEEYREEFFNSLPGHLKHVAKYLADGSVDPEDVYASLMRVEQNRKLDPTDITDQEVIAKNYLTLTDFGTAQEIAEQVEEWKEANTLGKKVATFKPKLDAMEEQQTIAYAQQAEEFKKEQEQAAQWYASSVEEVLRKGEIGGFKVDRKKQEQLYNSLLLDIQPSPRTGQPTNALWRKLEEIQVVKPDFDFFLEIADHILNREQFIGRMKQEGANGQQSKVTKELKTLQGTGANNGQNVPGEEVKKRTSGIVKQKYNPFETPIRR